MQFLRALVGRSPRLAVVLGKTLFLVGAILILAALFGRTLADAYPQALMSLVPQGPVGYAVCAVLLLIGMGLTVLGGEEAERKRARRR